MRTERDDGGIYELTAILDAEQDETTEACCCECSPPEFGGPIPDRDCPVHDGEAE